MLKRRHPDKNRILLVNITRLGDMLQATPTIAGMKLENPDAKITVLVEKQFESICRILPGIDEVISIDLGMTVRSLAREHEGIIDAYDYIGELVRDLRLKDFDYCLNMSSSAYTAMLLKLVGVENQGGWTSDDEGYRVIESDWAKLFATSVFHQNRQYNSLNLVDVFRCSADVDKHPLKLQIEVDDASRTYCRDLLAEAAFTNTGPLIAVQAGASQEKRQWAPERFVRFVRELIEKHNARVVMTGTKKELSIVEPIKLGVNSQNVFVAAGRTTIPQLSALLEASDLLVTGDTGPMHMSVAVGTPVVAMFLASAFVFETGPYSAGNIVIQPVIGCGPCNPNKSCGRPDCHDTIEPEWLAALTIMRLKEDLHSLPAGFIDPQKMVVYRSYFDQYGFCNYEPLSAVPDKTLERFRNAYRKLWLDDLGGYVIQAPENGQSSSSLKLFDSALEGVAQVEALAERGAELISQLQRCISDATIPAAQLGEINSEMLEVDRKVEELGFQHPPLGPVTRMFVFGKENLSGTDPLQLASQMKSVYQDLKRRCIKLVNYYSTQS
jgi:ADP-heptose:LPS heptosyltransferase